jgi:internalin A
LAQSSVRTLNLSSARLSAPASVSTLTELKIVELSSTGIKPANVAGLTGLTFLGLESNAISDISALQGLVNLRTLELADNQIADISVLAQLQTLHTVRLESNLISNLQPLRALPLDTVALDANAITSLTPLVENTNLSIFDLVSLYDNPFDCQGQAANIQALLDRHVTLSSDCN